MGHQKALFRKLVFLHRSSRTSPVSNWPPFGNFLRKIWTFSTIFIWSWNFFPAPARVVQPKFRPYGNTACGWYGGSGQRRKASSPLPSLPLNTHIHTGPSMTGGDGGGSHFVYLFLEKLVYFVSFSGVKSVIWNMNWKLNLQNVCPLPPFWQNASPSVGHATQVKHKHHQDFQFCQLCQQLL